MVRVDNGLYLRWIFFERDLRTVKTAKTTGKACFLNHRSPQIVGVGNCFSAVDQCFIADDKRGVDIFNEGPGSLGVYIG
jgi:hypothetical protein